MNTESPGIRSIEDSLDHGHDAAFRAEHLIGLIIDDLNGSAAVSAANGGSGGAPQSGVVARADHLGGRLEAIVRDLEHVRSKIVSNSPKAIAPNAAFAKGEQTSAGYAGHRG